MEIYVGFIIIILVIMAIYEKTKSIIFYYLATLIMCLFAGFRYYVGTDYGNYYYMFEHAKTTTFSNYKLGKGFLACYKIIDVFFKNPRVDFFIFSTFITIMIMFFIYKNSKFKFLSVVIYLGLGSYFIAFNIIRQFIAIAIISYVINYIGSKKKIRYYIGVILATLFHTTALFMFPMKYFIEKKWGKKIYIFLVFINIIIFLNLNTVIGSLVFDKRIQAYSTNGFLSKGSNPITLVVFILIFVFCYFNRKKIENGVNNKYYKLAFIGLLFVFLGTKGLGVSRMAEYFNLSLLILIPEVYLTLKNKKYYFLLGYIITLLFLAYGLILIMTQGNLIPYKVS